MTTPPDSAGDELHDVNDRDQLDEAELDSDDVDAMASAPVNAGMDLLRMFGGAGPDEFDAPASPTWWPILDADEVAAEMGDLWVWATTLQHRFPEMVRLPPCWYRHNGIVELLTALRDHERASYAETAAPTAGVAWHMAFRDVEHRLASWLSVIRCGGELNYHDQSVHAVTVPDTTMTLDVQTWISEAGAARTDLT